jgi:hypothetical protein
MIECGSTWLGDWGAWPSPAVLPTGPALGQKRGCKGRPSLPGNSLKQTPILEIPSSNQHITSYCWPGMAYACNWALGRLRQEDPELESSLDYSETLSQKMKKVVHCPCFLSIETCLIAMPISQNYLCPFPKIICAPFSNPIHLGDLI